jgi:hypothetical protein
MVYYWVHLNIITETSSHPARANSMRVSEEGPFYLIIRQNAAKTRASSYCSRFVRKFNSNMQLWQCSSQFWGGQRSALHFTRIRTSQKKSPLDLKEGMILDLECRTEAEGITLSPSWLPQRLLRWHADVYLSNANTVRTFVVQFFSHVPCWLTQDLNNLSSLLC